MCWPVLSGTTWKEAPEITVNFILTAPFPKHGLLNREWDTLETKFFWVKRATEELQWFLPSKSCSELAISDFPRNAENSWFYVKSPWQIQLVPKSMSISTLLSRHCSSVRVMCSFCPMVCEQKWVRYKLLVPLQIYVCLSLICLLSVLSLSLSLPSLPPQEYDLVVPQILITLTLAQFLSECPTFHLLYSFLVLDCNHPHKCS